MRTSCSALLLVLLARLAQVRAQADGGLPNLRRILYPSYGREPYEAAQFYSEPEATEGLWAALPPLSDLLDRSLRSARRRPAGRSVRTVQLERVPFYTGRG